MAGLTFAASLFVAGVLVVSAVPKLLAPLQFRQIVMQYALLPHGVVGAFSRALPVAELALAALLLTGVLARPAATLSAAMFGLFAAAVVLAPEGARRGNCGCLGRLHRQGAAWLVAQDLGLTAVAAFVAYGQSAPFRLYEPAAHAIPTHAGIGGLVLLTLALSVVLGYLIRWRPEDREVSQWRRHFQT